VLGPAEQEQIVVFERETVSFAHPLLRLVSYSAATAARRRQIHAAFAAVLRTSDPTRAVWHLAESALGPDDEIAASVEAVADETRTRGALAVAGELFERAGDLSIGRQERERRWLAAARSFDDSARPAQAARILERIFASTEEPAMRADVMMLLGVYCAFGESASRGCEILRTEAMRVEAADPTRSLLMLASAYTAAVLGVDFSAAAEITSEAGRVAAGAGPVGVLVAGALDLQTALFEGRYDDAARLRAPMRQMATALSESGVHEGDFLLQTTAFADLVMDDWQTAWTSMNGVIRRGRSAGRDGGLAFALAVASEAALRLGRWADAYVSARHAGDLYVDPADMSASRLTSFALCARVEAHLGLAESCRENAAKALAGAEPVGAAMLVIWARHALGLLALSRGDHLEAVRQLELVAAVADKSGAQDPGYLWWPADLIEAYWRSGRPADAVRVRSQLRFYGERTGSRSMMMVVSRWEAMLGPVERAEGHFADAIAAGESLGAPFEVARTELLLAEWRAANVGPVAEPLAAARLTFERLGASAWVERCEDVGPARPGEDSVVPARILTERELETALWAARGMTNREIADEMYLSPKTIEHALGRVYRKLGVRSRTQLAIMLAESA
jgi:DNA-binding CsgD family transcriptional regulator